VSAPLSAIFILSVLLASVPVVDICSDKSLPGNKHSAIDACTHESF
jgi:hypothetical protein